MICHLRCRWIKLGAREGCFRFDLNPTFFHLVSTRKAGTTPTLSSSSALPPIMVTGIETAGLVLAVLPLVVSAAKSYREGLRTIRGFLQFRELLKNLIHDLEVEQQKFQLTCEMLLANVIDTEKAHLLIENAVSSQGWDDEQLKRKLKARLGDSLTVYLDTVQDLSESLTAMGSIVGLDDRGNVCCKSRS